MKTWAATTSCIVWFGMVGMIWAVGALAEEKGRSPSAPPREQGGAPSATQKPPKTLEQLVAELKHRNPLVRVSAADALGSLGGGAAAAIPELLKGCEDRELWVAFAMTDALTAIGEPAIPALVEALEKGSNSLRLRAAQALLGMGPAAKAAEPVLRKALEDPTPRVRGVAATALRAINLPRSQKAKGASMDAKTGLLRTEIPGAMAAEDSDWPNFRGPRRDAISVESGLLPQWPPDGPKLLWTINGLGAGYSAVSISGGRLYTMGDRAAEGKKRAQYVLAFDLATRRELWATAIGPPHNDGPRCTPTLDGSLVFALGTEGDLVCLDAASGAIRWQRNLPRDFQGKVMTFWKFSESPLVDGDRLVCTPGGPEAAIVALDKKTGETLWKAAIPPLGEQGKDGAGYASMVVAEIEGVRQYIQLLGRGVVAVAADTGQFLWGYNRIANEVANIPTPIVRGNHVFVTTSYQTGSALLRIVRDKTSFKVEEVYYLGPEEFENHHGGVVLVGDWLFGGDGQNRGAPTCLHFATGEIAWKPKAPCRGSAAVLYADGHILFRYDRGDCYWVEANPREFRIAGNFRPVIGEGPAWAYPVIHDKKLYLRHGDILACYDLAAP